MHPNHHIVAVDVSSNGRILLVIHNAGGINRRVVTGVVRGISVRHVDIHPTHALIDIAVRRVTRQRVVHAELESKAAGGIGDRQHGRRAVEILAQAVGTQAAAPQRVAGHVLHVAACIEHVVAVCQSGRGGKVDLGRPFLQRGVVEEIYALDSALNLLVAAVYNRPVVDVLDAVFAGHERTR